MDDSASPPEGPRIPYRYEPDATAAGLAEQYAGLEPGTETGAHGTVAGRSCGAGARARRPSARCRTAPARSSCSPGPRSTPDFEGYGALSLGDWVGVTRRRS